MAERPLVPLSPEEQERRRPPRPWELMDASWEPIETPEPKLLPGRSRVIRLPRRADPPKDETNG